MQPASEPAAVLPAARRVREVGDLTVVGMAAGAAAGAWWAAPVPVAVLGLAVVPVAVPTFRSPLVLVPLAMLCCAALSARALDGLEPPAAGPVQGWATLVTDPERSGDSVRTDVRLHGRRYEVWWRGGDAGLVDERVAGDRLWVDGRVRAPDADDRAWYRPRHVTGRLEVQTLGPIVDAPAPWSWANRIRHVLETGMRSLGRQERALALGLLVGDDRDQAPEVLDDFRASGLTHLTAVSGQNVAFVLALASPLLRRLRLGGRFVSTLAVLALFGFVTRWEPSVMRAVTMAALAALGGLAGRPAGALRRVALAAIGLLLVDPLLVWSAGFRLSVAATAGIVVLAPHLSRRIPGPMALRQALAVTLAAQVGVAPLLLTFGPVPLGSVPANLLAGPAAGLAMAWGLPAGLLAGLVGGPWDAWLHLPTRLLVGWVAWVARLGATAPLPGLGPFEVFTAAAAIVVLACPGPRRLRRVAAVSAVLVVVVSICVRPDPSGARSAGGLQAWMAGGVTVVAVDRPAPAAALAHLRRWAVGRIDVLVIRSSSARTADVVALIARRHRVAAVIGPGSVGPGEELRLAAGNRFAFTVVADPPDRLDVAVVETGSGSAPVPLGSQR